MATVGCGISHKDTNNTDKFSNNKTKTTQKQGCIQKFLGWPPGGKTENGAAFCH
jgi:hypothetical protein